MKKSPVYYFSVVLCFLCLSSSAFGQDPTPSPTPRSYASDTEMSLIHYGDLIDVDVVGSFEFDWRGTLTPEGFLADFDKVPDPVSALCRSEGEIAAEIAREYGKILRNPNVVVRILDRSNRPMSVLQGAVRTSHRFQIKRPVFLNELLILAGGMTDRASGEISIFRPRNLNCAVRNSALKSAGGEAREKFIRVSQSNGAETMNIRISDLLSGDKIANPQILSGDIITVTEAPPIYVIGGVTGPRQLSSRSQLTLTRAISSAGGLAKEADGKVLIFRRRINESSVVEADLKKIRDGVEKDPVLEPFDVVDVQRKGREKSKTPPAIDKGSETARANLFPLRVID
jgi:protein involved in polysaccharide export with SLBB domain